MQGMLIFYELAQDAPDNLPLPLRAIEWSASAVARFTQQFIFVGVSLSPKQASIYARPHTRFSINLTFCKYSRNRLFCDCKFSRTSEFLESLKQLKGGFPE
jgi:hypothetical protein